jgi:ADP-ribosylglycohydrolase
MEKEPTTTPIVRVIASSRSWIEGSAVQQLEQTAKLPSISHAIGMPDIRSYYSYDVTCQGSVPESIIAFLESSDYESTIRNAISLGGDADTMAAIAGSIAEAFYGGVPKEIENEAWKYLDDKLTGVAQKFILRYML